MGLHGLDYLLEYFGYLWSAPEVINNWYLIHLEALHIAISY